MRNRVYQIINFIGVFKVWLILINFARGDLNKEFPTKFLELFLNLLTHTSPFCAGVRNNNTNIFLLNLKEGKKKKNLKEVATITKIAVYLVFKKNACKKA